MRFLTQIVEAPRNLNPGILSHCFNRIFISYAHQIKLLALAYKAQGVDYFFMIEIALLREMYMRKGFSIILIHQTYLFYADQKIKRQAIMLQKKKDEHCSEHILSSVKEMQH